MLVLKKRVFIQQNHVASPRLVHVRVGRHRPHLYPVGELCRTNQRLYKIRGCLDTVLRGFVYL